MHVFCHRVRHSPRFIPHPLHTAPQIRLYTKETLTLRRRRAASRSLPSRTVKAHPTRPKRPPPPKPEAFGKPRDLSSNAAKAERFKESRRIEKALRHEHHGENVYAYAHISTGQVVYSLTRVMDVRAFEKLPFRCCTNFILAFHTDTNPPLQNHQILSQLVFHGKKTVPASLRRDLWTPYFSLHFPSSYSGLLAYHQLRELSLQRQLQPPDHLVMMKTQTATKEDRARMSKEEEERWDKENEGKPFPDGYQRLANRRVRARILMMQRATSVADVAFVVDLMQQEGNLLVPASVEQMTKARRAKRLDEVGKRRRKRLSEGWVHEEMREKGYQEMARRVQEGTKWGLDMYAAKRIATEHGGIVVDPFPGRARVVLPGRQGEASQVEAAGEQAANTTAVTTTNTPEPPPEVLIFWSDLRDATFAPKWPEVVSHGELERLAVSRRAVGDATAQKQTHFTDRSVHVIGGRKVEGDDGWMRRTSSSSSLGMQQALDGNGDGGGDARSRGTGSGKSREQQTAELEKQGVVVDPSLQRRGILGWVKGRLGLAA